MSKDSYNSAAGVAKFDTEGYREHEEDAVNRYVVRGRVLDLGCGTGRTSILLHRKGLQVEAADYAPQMIERAREKYPNLSFHVMDAREITFPDATFDYVFFSYNGLDYLYPESDRLRALSEIRRVLKPGGIFIFTTHNARLVPNNLSRLKAFVKTALYGALYPYRYDFQEFGRLLTYFISPRKQKRQLESSGFEVVEVIAPTDRHPMYVARKPVVQ